MARKRTNPGSAPTSRDWETVSREGMNKAGHVAVAYTIIIHESGTKAFACELTDVTYGDVKVLEPGGSSEGLGFSMERLHEAIAQRTFNDAKPGWLPKRYERR